MGKYFRRAKSEWRSKFPPGHWALGMQKLSLLRLHNCAWLCLANVHGAVFAVGAAHRAARKRPDGGIGPYKRSKAPSDTP